MPDYFEESLFLHEKLRGKIAIQPKMNVRTRDDLSLVYSPGVAAPCQKIAASRTACATSEATRNSRHSSNVRPSW